MGVAGSVSHAAHAHTVLGRGTKRRNAGTKRNRFPGPPCSRLTTNIRPGESVWCWPSFFYKNLILLLGLTRGDLRGKGRRNRSVPQTLFTALTLSLLFPGRRAKSRTAPSRPRLLGWRPALSRLQEGAGTARGTGRWALINAGFVTVRVFLLLFFLNTLHFFPNHTFGVRNSVRSDMDPERFSFPLVTSQRLDFT